MCFTAQNFVRDHMFIFLHMCQDINKIHLWQITENFQFTVLIYMRVKTKSALKMLLRQSKILSYVEKNQRIHAIVVFNIVCIHLFFHTDGYDTCILVFHMVAARFSNTLILGQTRHVENHKVGRNLQKCLGPYTFFCCFIMFRMQTFI